MAKTIGDLARAKEKEGQNLFVAAASLYRQEGALFYLNDPLKALPSYRKATLLAPSNPEGWNMLGNVLQRTGDLGGAEQAYLKVEKLAGGDKSVRAVALGNLGNVYKDRGELNKAEEFYLKSLKIDKELGRKEGMAAKYANLGTLAETKGDMKTACGHWKKARDLFQELGAPHDVAKAQALLDKANCKK